MTLALLAVVAAYLVGNQSVNLWDRDEPRYAQTSRQMLESGDWVVPRLLDDVREKKPVFIYWCQAAAMALLRPAPFAARLPSVVGMTLTLIVLVVVLRRAVGEERTFWTVFIFATSGLTIGAAKMCITDGVLILFVTVSQLCLYQIWRGHRTWGVFIALGLALGFGILTKGPVVPAVMGMTGLVLLVLRLIPSPGNSAFGSDAQARIAAGAGEGLSTRGSGIVGKGIVCLIIAAAVLAPWLIAIEQERPGYIFRTLYQEVFLRTTEAQEGHRGPPGYYLLTIWIIFLPWSFFLPPAMIRAWRLRQMPEIRFALAAIVGPWIMFEIVQTKLPHYILPVYPALAFLVCDWLVARGRSFKLPLALGTGMLAGVMIVYGLILPHISQLRISNRVADILIHEGATHSGDVKMIDYKETSLAFYQGGTIRPERNNKYLVTAPPNEWPRWIVLTDMIWNQTPDAIKQQLDIVGTVHGLSYADRMRLLDVIVVRKKSPTTTPG